MSLSGSALFGVKGDIRTATRGSRYSSASGIVQSSMKSVAVPSVPPLTSYRRTKPRAQAALSGAGASTVSACHHAAADLQRPRRPLPPP